MLDYIVIGSGLAGITFTQRALKKGKSVLVFENHSHNASKVAAGVYNPVVLKRFNPVWQAKEQMQLAKRMYSELEENLGIRFDRPLPIYRKFSSVEEQNNWFEAGDKVELTPFLSNKILHPVLDGVQAPYGFGEVLHTGYIDTMLLIDSYRRFLIETNRLVQETFDYSLIALKEASVAYQSFEAKHIIFAEGFGMLQNPFFNKLPLQGTKGEILLIKAPDLELNVILKSSVFILPLGEGCFKVGATYNWKDKTTSPTKEGRDELVKNLREIITCEFEVIDHYAEIRPTVVDRKPLLGTHPDCDRLHILNGLGTRGVMLAPAMSKALYESIENGEELDPLINIKRFAHLLK